MEPRKRKVVLLSVAASVLLVLAAGAWLGGKFLETRSSACDCEDPYDGARIALWNPFRERASEEVAVDVLRRVKAGNCFQTAAMQPYCERELRFKIKSWRLTGIFWQRDQKTYRYWVMRSDSGGNEFDDPVWVTVLEKDGRWRANHVDLYY